ncbi:MAG: TatD family hydrolase [Chloroflexi bacterium]|nr:TatD family hydrolase [Chloroflexota bacterium]
MTTDTHAHLDMTHFDKDREEVILRALSTGVEVIISVGCDLSSSKAAIGLAERYPSIYAAVGFHPHDASKMSDEDLAQIAHWATHPRVVAVGEIGLDFYRNLSPPSVQREVFRRQLILAKDVDLPVIVHDRDAHEDVMTLIHQWVGGKDGFRGVLHCFSGNVKMAQECIELGFFISIAGPVTLSTASSLVEVVRAVPLERILIETDSPYLTPFSYGKRRNEPAFVEAVAHRVAEIKEVPVERVATVTDDNARRLFRFPHPLKGAS